eukprot:COSAG05_NODE_20154_length_282_cov_0.939891_1_plen_68_part_00
MDDSKGGHTHRKRAKAVFGKATKEVDDASYKTPVISKDFATQGLLQRVIAGADFLENLNEEQVRRTL